MAVSSDGAIGCLGILSPQDLISRARKVRDAWTASVLVARLMREGLEVLDRHGQVLKPYFDPADADPPNQAARPNLAVARFAGVDRAVAALTEAEAAMSGRLGQIEGAVSRLLHGHGVRPDEEAWDDQVSANLDICWVAVPGRDARAVHGAFELFGDRKALRDRGRLHARSGGRPGCTMCGTRPSVLGRRASQQLAKARPRDWRSHEDLCRPCLITRFALSASALDGAAGTSVPSVAEVAASSWLRRARGTSAGEDFAAAAQLAGWYDGDANGTATLGRALDAAYGVEPPAGWTQKSKGAFVNADERELLDGARRELVKAAGRPPARYALVAADGDDIGKAFTAAIADGTDGALSRRVQDYAYGDVPSALDRGSTGAFLVYAGGDDCRFLAPLAEVAQLVQALRGAFVARVGCTLSAGIAVAEVMEPLEVVVAAANEALDVAKQRPGKDALCFAWLGGPRPRFVVCPGAYAFTEAGPPHVLADDLALVAGAFGDRHGLSAAAAAAIYRVAEQVPPDDLRRVAVLRSLVAEILGRSERRHPAAEAAILRWVDVVPGEVGRLVRLARDLGAA